MVLANSTVYGKITESSKSFFQNFIYLSGTYVIHLYWCPLQVLWHWILQKKHTILFWKVSTLHQVCKAIKCWTVFTVWSIPAVMNIIFLKKYIKKVWSAAPPMLCKKKKILSNFARSYNQLHLWMSSGCILCIYFILFYFLDDSFVFHYSYSQKKGRTP